MPRKPPAVSRGRWSSSPAPPAAKAGPRPSASRPKGPTSSRSTSAPTCRRRPTPARPRPTWRKRRGMVEKYDRRIVTSITDVRDYDGVRAAVERGVAELGRLDVVVANAGMTTAARSWEIPLENWDATIGICLTGAYYTARAAIPVLIEQGAGGAIVFTSSVAGWSACPCWPTTSRPSTASPAWPRPSPTSSASTASG